MYTFKKHSSYLNDEGARLYNKGNVIGAKKYFEDALFLYPKNYQAITNLGLCLVQDKNYKGAIKFFKNALKINPQYSEAHINLANAYLTLNDVQKSLEHYSAAAKDLPKFPKNYLNLGQIYIRLGNTEKAEKYYKLFNKIDNENFDSQNNLGVALSRQGKQTEALKAYKKAIKLNPDSKDAYFNTGIAYSRLDDYENAVKWFRKTYKIDPTYDQNLAHLVNRMPYNCDWRDRDKLSKELDAQTSLQLKKGVKPAEQPFMNIIRSADPKRNLDIARAYSKAVETENEQIKKDMKFIFKPHSRKKIRLGYASNGFRSFPTAHNIMRVLELHNRKRFEVYLYSFGENDKSIWRKRAEKLADKFIDIVNFDNIQTAKRIYNDQVDILIDLKGYTGDNKIDALALKPAPIIVSLLGFVGSTGSSFHDYMIVDRTVVPAGEEKYYTEKLIFMPDTYWPTDNTAEITEIKLTKNMLKLPSNSFVYCSFNNPYKIEPDVFKVWMNILRSVPNSVLWTIILNKTQLINLRTEAARLGVNPNRILFAGNVIKPHHLARMKFADVALDTKTVNGHTTTTDALWAGVPVITIYGTHFASRVSSSMLKAIGLPELITHSLKEYESLALELALNPTKLQSIKSKLEKNKLTYPLFDTEKYTRNLENTYIRIVEEKLKK